MPDFAQSDSGLGLPLPSQEEHSGQVARIVLLGVERGTLAFVRGCRVNLLHGRQFVWAGRMIGLFPSPVRCVVAQNFFACDREQELLLPPSVRDWLPEDHLAWLVLDAVAAFDLEAFYASYRRDGWGRAAQLNSRGKNQDLDFDAI
ncbi:MAG: hypothetical protein ACRDLS_13115 [Solirubrobacteraceae bacterium]